MASGVPTPRLDAEVLLAAAMSADRAALYARLRAPAPAEVAMRFAASLSRRTGREPLAYITGEKEFYSLPFLVTRDVLVPRPETEQLVDAVCRLLRRRARAMVCDIGTGSGCVAVAVARTVATARVLATDVSPSALALARRNAVRHGVDARVAFIRSDLAAGVRPDAGFDVVVSNPPYLSSGDPVTPEVSWEPRSALAAGGDGLAVIRRLVQCAPDLLKDGGALVMEFGYGQAHAVAEMASGVFASVTVERDLAGLPRVLVASRRVANGR